MNSPGQIVARIILDERTDMWLAHYWEVTAGAPHGYWCYAGSYKELSVAFDVVAPSI